MLDRLLCEQAPKCAPISRSRSETSLRRAIAFLASCMAGSGIFEGHAPLIIGGRCHLRSSRARTRSTMTPPPRGSAMRDRGRAASSANWRRFQLLLRRAASSSGEKFPQCAARMDDVHFGCLLFRRDAGRGPATPRPACFPLAISGQVASEMSNRDAMLFFTSAVPSPGENCAPPPDVRCASGAHLRPLMPALNAPLRRAR
jgi:hypothetical protein